MVLMFKILNVLYCEIHVIKHIVTKKYSHRQITRIKTKIYFFLIFMTDAN